MPAGDWAQAGRISSQRFNNAMTAVAVNSLNPNRLIQESMKSRSREKQMAMKAESVLRRTEKDIEVFEARNDAEATIRDANMDLKKTQRKAGLLAAGAAMIGGTIMDAKRDKTPPPTFQSDLSGLTSFIQKKEGSLQEKIDELRILREKGPDQATAPSFDANGNLKLTGSTLGDQSEQTASTLGDQAKLTNPASYITSSNVVNSMGFTDKEFNVFKNKVAGIESGGTYNIAGGSGGHYDGKYQLGAAAKTDAARQLGISDPGHSPEARKSFRSNPKLQEKMFEGFTKANHSYLMGIPEYASASNQRKLEILGYAHNQGMGGAAQYLRTGQTGYDGFGTAGTKYIDAIRSGFQS